MPYKVYEGELNSPNDNVLSRFENVPALRKADIALNRATGGGNETISARVGREQQNSPFAKAIADQLNAIDPGHTDRAVLNAESRSYKPYEGSIAPVTPSNQQPPERTPMENLLRVPGRMARTAITGATGTGSVLADALASGVNLFGGNMEMPSQALQNLMTRAGLPQSEGMAENIADTLGSFAMGGLDPAAKALQVAAQAKNVPAAFGAAQAAAHKQTIQELQQAGIKVLPSSARGSIPLRTLEGVGGTNRTAEMLRDVNESTMNALAKKAIKFHPDSELTREALGKQADDLVKNGYDPIKQAGKIIADAEYKDTLKKVIDKYTNKSFPEMDRAQITDLVDKVNKKQYDAADALQIISRLRMEAKDAFKPGGDTALGKAKLAITKALEDNIERQLKANADTYILQQTVGAAMGAGSRQTIEQPLLGQARNTATRITGNKGTELSTNIGNIGPYNPQTASTSNAAPAATGMLVKQGGPNPVEMLQNFRDTRIALAKNYAVERMLQDSHTGNISAVKAAGLLTDKVPLTDELLTIAKAGSPKFSAATGPSKGKPVPYNAGDAAMFTGGGLASFFTGPAGATLASIPFVKSAARHAIMSKPMQNMLMRSAVKNNGSIFGTPAGQRMLLGAPAQALPLFSQGEE